MSEHTIGIMIAMAVYGAAVSVIAFYKSLKIQGLRVDLKHVQKLNKELVEDLNHTKDDAESRINGITRHNEELRRELNDRKPKRDKSGKFAPKNESAQVKLPKGVKRFNIDGTKSKGDDLSFVVKIDSENALLSFVAGATHQGYKMFSGEKPEWLLKNFDMRKKVLFVGKKHRVIIVTTRAKAPVDYFLGSVGDLLDYKKLFTDHEKKRAEQSNPEKAEEKNVEIWGGESSGNSEQLKPRPISSLKPTEAIRVNNDAERDAILKLMGKEGFKWGTGHSSDAYKPDRNYPYALTYNWLNIAGIGCGGIEFHKHRGDTILPASDFLPTEPKAEQSNGRDVMLKIGDYVSGNSVSDGRKSEGEICIIRKKHIRSSKNINRKNVLVNCQ